jgi:DNA-binding response OmpR family regulator
LEQKKSLNILPARRPKRDEVAYREVAEEAGVAELPLVLIVEDEYLLRGDLEAVLSNGGFASKAAFTGKQALTLFMQADAPYKALITEVRLGEGLNGWEVARHLREKEPSLLVIYVTGSSSEEWATNGVPNSILVPKPFAPAQLLNALSDLLTARRCEG